MKYPSLCALIVLLSAGQAAHADLTLRHTMEFKFGSFLPPAAIEAMKTQLADSLPKESLVQVKGTKVLTSMGRMVMLADYSKGQITLMDPRTKRFATSPSAAYADQIAAVQKQRMPMLPAQAQAMFANMKFDVKTEQSGKTAVIQGIRADETVMVMLLEIPNPTGMPMQMRTEMHQWIASPEEANRLPALKELEVYGSLPKAGMDPVEMMTKTLASFPGMADKLQATLKDLAKNMGKATLRMQTSVYMPSMTALLGAGAADQPVTEVSMELAELSSAPLPDSRFEVPADYQSAPMEEMLGVLFPAPKLPAPAAAPQARIPAGEQPAILERSPGTGTAYKVGNGVSAPMVISQNQPGYTEEARAAKIQGTVLLSLVVGPDGVAEQIRVLRSLDPGLDQKAVETVSRWKFKPGMKDGKAVAVQAQIEVNFRLM